MKLGASVFVCAIGVSELARSVSTGSLTYVASLHVTGFPYIHSRLRGTNSTLGTFRHDCLALDAEQHITGYNLIFSSCCRSVGRNPIMSRRPVLVVLLPCVGDRLQLAEASWTQVIVSMYCIWTELACMYQAESRLQGVNMHALFLTCVRHAAMVQKHCKFVLSCLQSVCAPCTFGVYIFQHT